MSDFEFFQPKGAFQVPLHLVHHLKRCPLKGLVDGDDESGFVRHGSDDVGEDDDQQADDSAVDGKPDEFAAFDDVDHPFAGHATDDKSRQEADQQGECSDGCCGVGRCHVAAQQVFDVEQGFAQNRRNDHQERELGQFFLFVAQQQTRGNGAS